MDELSQILRGMEPGQIEQAVQLLQRYKATNQQNNNNNNNNNNDNNKENRRENDSISSAIALALRQAVNSSGTENIIHNDSSEEEENKEKSNKYNYLDEDDTPLAILMQMRQKALGKKQKKNNNYNKENKSVNSESVKSDETSVIAVENENIEKLQQKQQKSVEVNKTPSRKEKKNISSSNNNKSGNSPQQPAIAARSLASFGFISAVKKLPIAACDKNKLFTPFVQDKRVVPLALQFWNHDKDETSTFPPPPPLNHSLNEEFEENIKEHRHSIALDDNSSSLMHSPVMCCGEHEEIQDVELHEEFNKSFSSFTNMIETMTNKLSIDTSHNNSQQQLIEQPKQNSTLLELQCPCRFHVRLSASRAGFNNEVIFCGFYAIGYDPCQSRPPYFGTYNSQDSLNKEELLKLARFELGSEMPQISNLDYDYDSGDDWDIIEGDEDLGASSASDDDDDDDDENNNTDSSLSFIDDDFINDNNEDNDDEDNNDSDVELQRKMVEARQRRINRLRHKDKLVPAFSGPFTGIAILEHPLREYDRLERISSSLDGNSFTILLEQEIKSVAPILFSASSNVTGVGNSSNNNIGVNDNTTQMIIDEQEQQQRLIAAALRNRREMFPEELEVVHNIIAANARVYPKTIVDLLQQQQQCIGVTRAEILRTIRRYYDRQHNVMIRRPEPWSATDERLFSKKTRPKSSNNNNNQNKINNNNNNCEDEEVENNDEDEDEEEELTLVALACKRPRSSSAEVEGE